MPSMKKKNAMTLLLDDETKQMLTTLHETTNRSRGLLLREMIRSNYHMLVQGIPFCANGQRCLAPQMHTVIGNPKQE